MEWVEENGASNQARELSQPAFKFMWTRNYDGINCSSIKVIFIA